MALEVREEPKTLLLGRRTGTTTTTTTTGAAQRQPVTPRKAPDSLIPRDLAAETSRNTELAAVFDTAEQFPIPVAGQPPFSVPNTLVHTSGRLCKIRITHTPTYHSSAGRGEIEGGQDRARLRQRLK